MSSAESASQTPAGRSPWDAPTGVLPAAEVSGAPQRRVGWNTGTDAGLLVLRLVLGGTFVGHGSQKLFGVFGGQGIGGFADTLQASGYPAATAFAVLTGVAELAGGALLALGLFTPLAAAALLGVMVNAVGLKWGGGFFAADDGFEFELALAAMAAALTLTGPGRLAADRGLPWFRHPVVSGWVCLVFGLGAGLVFALLLRG